MTKPYESKQIYKILDPDVASWFRNKYEDFTPPQKYSVKLVSDNKNVLVSSPTGTGKTLSAFLGIINRLVGYAKKGKLENKVYAIYISPLKALGNDIERNLDVPLREIENLVRSNGEMQDIRHGVRNGDTTPYQKQKMNKYAPHILITTPESLALMLCAPKFKEKISDVETIVIDEIHSLAENKRGTHLSLSLERLENICSKPLTRIGLSATISPIKEMAHYLIGERDRKCKIVDVSYMKERDLKVIAPEKDPLNSSSKESHDAMYKVMVDIIKNHNTTLIFTNTRSGTESVVMNLKHILSNKYEDVDSAIVTHHSSLSKDKRLEVEENLKSGKAKVVVSSTSLELGIDIGSIDVVIQIGSPKSIARCLQRVGRAGHNLSSITKGYFICPDSDDLVEVAVMLKKSYEHKVDSIIMPKRSLDVLSQHVMGMSLEKKWEVDEAYALVKKAYPYSDLLKKDFISVLEAMAGNEDLDKAKVYGKIWYDKETKMFGRRGKLAKLIYMSNIGTIPDETKISVMCQKKRVGYIEEGFVEKLKKGDVFVLGGSNYRYRSSAGVKIRVEQVFDQKPTVPRWFSEQLPLSFDLADDIRKFKSHIINSFNNKLDKKDIIKLISEMPVDPNAAEIIYKYMETQYLYMKKLSGSIKYNKNTLLIEYFDSKDGFKIIFHALYGRRVNDALSRTVAFLIGKRIKKNVGISISDNGFMLHVPKKIFFDLKILHKINYLFILKESLDNTTILRRRFRHVSSRGLMVLKRYKGWHMSVGRQQMTSTTLLNIVKKEDGFPLLEETYREIMEDYLDLANFTKVMKDLDEGKIDILRIETKVPTPFAHNLMLLGMSDIVLASSRKEMLKSLYLDVQREIEKK